jgi:hypothetical protein
MNLKVILVICAMASSVAAAPAEDLEKWACQGKTRYCCELFFSGEKSLRRSRSGVQL